MQKVETITIKINARLILKCGLYEDDLTLGAQPQYPCDSQKLQSILGIFIFLQFVINFSLYYISLGIYRKNILQVIYLLFVKQYIYRI